MVADHATMRAHNTGKDMADEFPGDQIRTRYRIGIPRAWPAKMLQSVEPTRLVGALRPSQWD